LILLCVFFCVFIAYWTPYSAYFAYCQNIFCVFCQFYVFFGIKQKNCIFFWVFSAYSTYFAYYLHIFSRVYLHIFHFFLCTLKRMCTISYIICIFCLFCISCIFCILFSYWIAKRFAVWLDQMTYFAYCTAYFPGWGGKKQNQNAPIGILVTIGCRDSNQGTQRHKPFSLPTKPRRATTVKLSWSNVRKRRLFIKLFDNCFVPHERAKRLTYHQQHPSPASYDLSQAAPGKPADFLPISNGIVPAVKAADSTGTRGRRPSMADTGTTVQLHTIRAHFFGAYTRWLTGMYPTTVRKTVLKYP
jgi:hypothetical protein